MVFSASTRQSPGNEKFTKFVFQFTMSRLNEVAEAMETCAYEPTVHLFGWNQRGNGLTDDLGQPKGEPHEMTLNSMKHAIIMNKGDIQTYKIKIGLVAGFEEYILILNQPRIVFVARYNVSEFRNMIPEDFCQDVNRLSGLMNAKVHEIDKKDGPPELSPREDTKLVIYYPGIIIGSRGGEMPHYHMPILERTFSASTVRLTKHPYPRETCTLVIEQGNTGAHATHYIVQ